MPLSVGILAGSASLSVQAGPGLHRVSIDGIKRDENISILGARAESERNGRRAGDPDWIVSVDSRDPNRPGPCRLSCLWHTIEFPSQLVSTDASRSFRSRGAGEYPGAADPLAMSERSV